MNEEIRLDSPTPHTDDETTVEGLTSSPSIVDLIKQDVSDLEEITDVLIPVPGYESSHLTIRYRLPKGKELDELVTKNSRETKDEYYRGINTAMDSMILLCTGIFVQPPDHDEPIQLDINGQPVKLNATLATFLNWSEMKSSREVVRYLFRGNDLAIGAHSARLQKWLVDVKADVSSTVWDQMGEFLAAR
jgi:hypothetical protein